MTQDDNPYETVQTQFVNYVVDIATTSATLKKYGKSQKNLELEQAKNLALALQHNS